MARSLVRALNRPCTVDKVIDEKYGPAGTYCDIAIFDKAYKNVEYGDAFLKMANQLPKPEAVEYAKEICNYVYDTYGRFPAHSNPLQLPGVWRTVEFEVAPGHSGRWEAAAVTKL